MLTQGAPSPHDAILLAGSPERAALRMGDWKLLMNASEVDSEEATEPAAKQEHQGKRTAKANGIELYHLTSDIGEKTNLADKEPERVALMREKLREML